MMKLMFKIFLSASAVLVFGGCQTIYEGKYDWHDGWRPGTVLEVGAADQLLKVPFLDCRPLLSAAEKSAYKFATISYRYLGNSQKAVVPISPESTWRSGDPVYLNVLNCRTALERRPSDS